jgi:hypothetical protein
LFIAKAKVIKRAGILKIKTPNRQKSGRGSKSQDRILLVLFYFAGAETEWKV